MNTMANSALLKEKHVDKWILFMIWPFGTLLKAVGNLNKNWSKYIIWASLVYFGYCIIIQPGSDGERYIDNLNYVHQNGFSLNTLLNVYTGTTSYFDILYPLTNFFIAQFTNDSRILFAIFSFIFGYFFVNNLFYLRKKIANSLKKRDIILLLIIVLIVPIWNILNFRLATAIQIFLFGMIPFLLEKKYKHLLWALLSVFIHFSFIIPVLILTIYLISGNRIKLYFIFFIMSIFISEINLNSLQELFISYAPEFLLPKASYLNVAYAESIVEKRGDTNWYVIWHVLLVKYFLATIFVFIYFRLKKTILKSGYLLNLFSFSILFFAFANVISLIPSGGRFMTISFFFSTILLLLLIQQANIYKILKPILLLSSPAVILFIIVKIRMGFDYLGLATILANPFIAPFITNDIPLIDLIK